LDDMKKDFLKWHKVKSLIHESSGLAMFQEREVWWCSLNEDIFKQLLKAVAAVNFSTPKK